MIRQHAAGWSGNSNRNPIELPNPVGIQAINAPRIEPGLPTTMHGYLQTICRATCTAIALLALCGLPAGCVYQVDVQQGNKLEPKDVERVKVGMTRNQVRFLLGTPMVSDVFHDDRWDYFYYFRPGRSNDPERRWLIVWFDGDVVREIQRDVQAQSS